jgi:DNA-binding NarL/FixJ family response regulator
MEIRVLVVDDHPVVRRGLVLGINSDPGLDVVGEACDGHEGLRLAQEHRPDVVLLDLHMPESSGMLMLERLRIEQPTVRVVVLTATEHSETMFNAIAAGAAGYLTKRSTHREILNAIITVYGGGSVVSPHLASELLRDYSAASRGEPSPVRSVLTQREHDVLRLMSQGLTDREIAAELYISPRTVQNHLAAVRVKTGRRRRAELTRWATEHMIA